MATTTQETTSTKPLTRKGNGAQAIQVETTNRGKTYVSDEVVTTIARIAAEQVEGVYSLGDTGLRGILDKMTRNTGVDSEVGMKQAAITLDVVVEFGYRLADVATALRERVIESVQYMASREVVSVDINIVDINIPKQEQSHSRVLE